MARTRRDRLEHLLRLQRQVTALHEMRHAGFVATAAEAQQEAEALVAATQESETLHDLFPDVYARRIAAAYERRAQNRGWATAEAAKVSAETARTNIVERSFAEARRDDERERLERDVLDAVERLVTRGGDAK